MIWKKTFIKPRLETTTKEEVLLLISFLREEETRTDGAIIIILNNSLLSKTPLIILPVLFLQKMGENYWWYRNIVNQPSPDRWSSEKLREEISSCPELFLLDHMKEHFQPI